MTIKIDWNKPREDLEWDIAQAFGWTKDKDGRNVAPNGLVYRQFQSCPWMRITHDFQCALNFSKTLEISPALVFEINSGTVTLNAPRKGGDGFISHKEENPALALIKTIVEYHFDS